MPRRPRRAKAVAIEPEPSLLARMLLHSPKDTFASAVAGAAMIAIIFNALFLQQGRHPAPWFGTSSEQVTQLPVPQPMPRARPADADVLPQTDMKLTDPKPMVAPAMKPAPAPAPVAAPAAVTRPPAPVPQAHSDPVGDLINSNRRIVSVQRVLTEYGYGQLKPTGVAGTDTQAAIRKFETDRKHAPTGQISDWLLQEMAKLTGKPIN